MGKTRAYKHRLDKYYHLAHAVGYRSRAAFKLIQLNQQYDFLTNATYCLDLCAAPGGWSQVAAKYMPAGSTVIAIDLAPIKPIPHVITLQSDITAPKTQAKVRKIMQGSRCDVVLNDGAPNVGAAWITDSTNQLDLCLASLKFATLFLKKGGAFVTKVFRSEHYNSLIWVLNQFFEQVIPTKPKASRDTSAELFIVCLQFKAPTMVDPRMLDPQYVFRDLEELTKKPLPDQEAIEMKTAMDYTSYKISDYLVTENPKDILNTVNELVFDDGPLAVAAFSHPNTNNEIKTLCNDLKVIGLADKAILLKWRRQMRAALLNNNNDDNNNDVDNEEIDSDEEIQNAVNELKLKRKHQEKVERRRKEKMKTQLIKRLQKNLTAPSANADMLDPEIRYGKMYTPSIPEEDLSHLTYEEIRERNIDYLENLDKENGVIKGPENNDGEIMGPQPKLRNFKILSEEKPKPVFKDEEEDEDEDDTKPRTKEEEAAAKTASIWFSHPLFNNSSDDDDEEDQQTAKQAIKDDIKEKQAKENKLKQQQQQQQTELSEKSENEYYSDSDESEELLGQSIKDFDALAYKASREILTSKHRKNEMINDSFNRYMHDDGPAVPSWFTAEESQYNKPMIPVTKQDVAEWRQRMRSINEVETKRVIEARARKKAKALQRLKSAQEKADEIAEKEGLDERSKLRMMEQIAAKGMAALKPKEKVVFVRKRDNGSPSIPRGKGRVRLVDKRGKKDLRAEKFAAKRPAHVIKKKKSKYIHRKK